MLTVHQLSHATSMSVRNIRAHQTRGLLPPPVRRGRSVLYTARHVERLEAIKALQREGYNLAAIEAHFAPRRTRLPDHQTLRLLKEAATERPMAVANLLRHGIVVISATGTIEVVDDSALSAAFELRRHGMSFAECTSVLAELVDAIAPAVPELLQRVRCRASCPDLLDRMEQLTDRGGPGVDDPLTTLLAEAFRVSARNRLRQRAEARAGGELSAVADDDARGRPTATA